MTMLSTVLTICIKVLPDFQETSCIQVIKSAVHCDDEMPNELQPSARATQRTEKTNC